MACLPRRLGFFSFVLFLAYGLLLLRVAIPIRLVLPSWQISLSNGLIENAPIPLVGMALLYVASYIDPEDERISRHLLLVARVSAAASLAFLLLIPLRVFSVWSLAQQSVNIQDRRLDQLATRLNRVNDALRQSSNKQQLIILLQQYKAPPLPPQLLAQPFELIRQELGRSIETMRNSMKGKRASTHQVILSPRSVIENIRYILLSFVYFLGFAAGGQLSATSYSFLDEILNLFDVQNKFKRDKTITKKMQNYIELISGDDQENA